MARLKYKSGNTWVASTLPIRIGGSNSMSYDLTQMNQAASQFLSEVTYTFANPNAYDADEYATSSVQDYVDAASTAGCRGDHPVGQSITLSTTGDYTITDCDGRGIHEIPNKSGTFNQYNLTPGGKASYTNIASKQIKDSGVIYPTGQLRMIYTDTVLSGSSYKSGNFRDIGGWACDGGTLKYGKIFRGVRLNGGSVRCSATDAVMFKQLLNVKDEIDLRNDTQAKNTVDGQSVEITESALGDGVSYFRRAIAAYSSAIVPGSTSAGYCKDIYQRMIEDFKANKPIYLHCMAGADRTGTICFILEALCGVSRSDLDKDYELTSFTNYKLSDDTTITTEFIRYRTRADYKGLVKYFFDHYSGSCLRDRVVAWCLDIGLSYQDINDLRNYMIDGNPSPINPPSYTVSVTSPHATVAPEVSSVTEGETYTSTVTPDQNYEISTVTVTMNNVTVQNAFDSSNNTITVANVTGNIVVTVVATEVVVPTYTVQATLTHATLSPEISSVNEGDTYTSTVVVESGCTLDSVAVSMGGTPVQNAFDSTNNTITVTNVTGNISITVNAIAPAPPNILTESFTSHGTTYPAVGYEDGVRISSSTGKTTADASCFATGFIPIVDHDVLTFDGVTIIESSSGDGKSYIGLYDVNEAKLGTLTIRLNADGSSKSFSGFYTLSKDTSSGTTKYNMEITLGQYSATVDTTNAKYARLGLVGSGENCTMNLNA